MPSTLVLLKNVIQHNNICVGQGELKEVGPRQESRRAQLDIHMEYLGSNNLKKEIFWRKNWSKERTEKGISSRKKPKKEWIEEDGELLDHVEDMLTKENNCN